MSEVWTELKKKSDLAVRFMECFIDGFHLEVGRHWQRMEP